MDTGDLRKECEEILAAHDAVDLCVVVEARRREDILADIRLVFADRGWLQSAEGNKLVRAFREHPMTTKAQRRKSTIQIRFQDEILADLEHELAAGKPAGMRSDDIAAGEKAIVSYIGPNTNKALHVGHLRNIYIGEGLASSLDAAGAEVNRLNLVGDIGRRVCEAMAGYMGSHQGEAPADTGISGDRFVEHCCREFSRQRVNGSASEGDPNAEEREALGDLADTLMTAWLEDSAEERELWLRMRGWTLEGHARTLARLGIEFDEYGYESSAVPRAIALIDEGVERGVFEREESGSVVYRTGQLDYPTMVLLRDDGFPTEHSRLMGAYDELLDELDDGEVYVEVAGLEWQPAIAVICSILERLRPGPRNEANLRVFHGSLTEGDGQKIGSSTGEPIWIDDFLDEIEAGPAVSALEQLSYGCVSREELADLLTRGTFLCSPANRPLAFVQEALIEGHPGPGWTIAEAWCRAQLARASKRQEEAPARTVVMQSQQFRLSLQRTVQRHDVTSLSRYLLSLAEACLALPTPGPAAAPMLERVLGALGFLARSPVDQVPGAEPVRI